MSKYEISLDDIVNLRDCSHDYRRGIETIISSEQYEYKKYFHDITDKLDRVVQRILWSARHNEDKS